MGASWKPVKMVNFQYLTRLIHYLTVTSFLSSQRR